MSDPRYWLALNFLSDIGPVLSRKLLSMFRNPEDIFRLSLRELRNIENIGEHRARSIAGFNEWNRVQKELDEALQKNIRLITIHDGEYPEALKHVPDAPIIIYMRGEIRDDDRYAVAVVGSRAPSGYGLRVAENISCKLASCGLTVVSGMARGIDSVSHKGALKAKGRTIAVLGSGLDKPYPSENIGLMRAVSSSGAVISEFPFGTDPNRENFPRRNRIISALSLGVVVIEAAVDSGSLITVRYALEQGREVFAVPGNVTSRNSKGTNRLIKEGAKLVESAEEIVEELRPQIKGFLRERDLSPEKKLPEMNDEEKVLYGFLDDEPKHIDMIIRKTNISTHKALSILLGLELKGAVRQVEGKKFLVNSSV